ncbi:MAG TPA: ribose-phosphate diphosphokinase [Myxococcaceae bacterium]|nr:ribose-phosphate diphosphokinase [Myxococcaceae bacterium]
MGERAIRPRLIFSTVADAALAEQLCALGVGIAGEIERETFLDGERGLRVASRVADQDAILVGGTGTDADTLELYDLACTLVECELHALTLVVPYFGYSTQERRSKDGESVTAKTRARLLSSIPLPSGGLRVLLVDLHTAGLPFYFEGGVRPVHVTARPLFAEAIRAHAPGGCVVASTDAGRAKYVEALANDLRVDASFVFKRRDAGGTRVVAVSARVAGQDVMLYDDMVRTGSSLIAAAEAYREAGASKITALATHGVLPGDAASRLEQSGLFTRLIVTDTHPRARQLAGGFVEVRSVVPLLAAALQAR